jgi:hypothetical protein
VHRAEVLGNHGAQLVVPFFLFAPQPAAAVAGAIILATQGWLILSGNFSWLNFLTMALALSAFDDHLLGFLPLTHPDAGPLPLWWLALVSAFTAVMAVLSYRPARNLVTRRQLMNFRFNPLHLANAYGAFGSITRERHEVVIEGTADPAGGDASWEEYEFKGKPGDPRRRPPQVAPYHLRLDWQLWFAALEPSRHRQLLVALIGRLLRGDRSLLRLLRRNPFPATSPAAIRARIYAYRFTSPAERRRTGAWWARSLVREYVPPVSLGQAADSSRDGQPPR